MLCCMFNINVTASNILWVKHVKQKNGVVIIITKVLRECVGLKRYKIWTVKRTLTLATQLGKQALRKSGRLAALSIVAVLLSTSGTSAQAHLQKCAHLVAAGDGTETRNSMIVFLQKFFIWKVSLAVMSRFCFFIAIDWRSPNRFSGYPWLQPHASIALPKRCISASQAAWLPVPSVHMGTHRQVQSWRIAVSLLSWGIFSFVFFTQDFPKASNYATW